MTSTSDALNLTPEDYQKAAVEVAFLLDAFASTIDNIMGGNTAPVGRIAGRDTAKKLPIQLDNPELSDIVKAVQAHMQAGFDFTLEDKQLQFRKCIIRDMCALRRIDTGGPLCQLFHAYFDGIVNGLISRPVKSRVVSVGDVCHLETVFQ